MNEQPITPQKLLDENILLVKEIFWSIQGEGPWVGHPCVFVRLSNCNLCCTWCDTDYTGGEWYSHDSLVEEIYDTASPHAVQEDSIRVVITGGEPFAQKISGIVYTLTGLNMLVQIETNGTLSNPNFPWTSPKVLVVCSPKAGKIHKDINAHVSHFKYVVGPEDVHSADGLTSLPTQAKGKRPPPRPSRLWNRHIWVMARDGKNKEEQSLNDQSAATIAADRNYRYSPRVHKLLNWR